MNASFFALVRGTVGKRKKTEHKFEIAHTLIQLALLLALYVIKRDAPEPPESAESANTFNCSVNLP